MASLWQRLLKLFTRKTSTKTRRRSHMRKWLRLESLEIRTTMDATISGVVFTDANENGTRETTEALLGNITVRLYRDVNADGLLDAGDTLVDTEVTPSSGVNQGRYTLTATATGQHLVVQDTVAPGLIQRANQRIRTVNVTSIAEAQIAVIDNFNVSTPLFTADPSGVNPNFATTGSTTTNIIGGLRDLHANAAAGALTVDANQVTPGVLGLGNSPAGQGIYLATYDGDATNATNQIGTGLGAGSNDFDMTNGGTVSFLRLQLAAEANLTGDATLTIRGRDNNSTEILLNAAAIPERASAADPLLTIDVPFASFPAGFDPTQVGGLQFEVSNIAGQQVVIDNIGLFGGTPLPAQDIANLNPMTIGNQVFRDINNNGLLDGADSGIGGVTVQLYEDTDGNGSLSPAELTAIPTSTTTSTTVGSVGQYSFTGLFPGSYVVVIPNSQFNASAPLDNMATSIIPAAPPVNNANTGVLVAGLGVASAVTLVANDTRVIDNDTDPNTNLSRDFGFAPPALSITKDDNPNIARVGDQLTYTIVVRNDSPTGSGRDSTNTIITDTLPTGLSLVGTQSFTISNPTGTGADATFNTGTRLLTANVGTLVPGQLATLTVIATVGGTFVNDTVNTANATNAEGSTVTATVTTPLTPNVDLGITKTIVGGATTVGLGGTFTYRLTLTNITATTVTGIEVTDNLPPNFNPGTLPAGVALDTTTADPNDLIWSIATLAGSGTAVFVDIPITVANTAALGSTTNTATIDVSPTGLVGFNDTNPLNNSSSIPITVQPRYDLRVTKTNGLTTVATGQTFTYTLQAVNNGPSEATNVTITDNLPASLEFVSASTGSVTGTTFTANVGTVAGSGGTSAAVNVVVRVRSSATGANIVNIANVAAADPGNESDTTNNSATDTDTLTRSVVLNVNKDDTVDPVALGATFNYVVTAFNSGTADTTNVVFTDILPTGLEFVSAGSGFTVNETVARTGTVTFNTTTRTATASLGTLLPGSATSNQATITLVVRASTTATPGTITNTAQLTSDDNPAGVTNSETTQLVGLANLTGRVYVDADRNGLFGAGEAGVPGVTINLTGTATAGGAAVTRTTTTDASGVYAFNDLPIGTYTIVQVQPTNYRSSATNVGTVGGVATGTGTENQIATINLTGDSIANNFGELLVRSKRLFLSSTTA